MDKTHGIKCLPGFQDNSDQRTSWFWRTKHTTSYSCWDASWDFSGGEERNRKNQAKLCSELLNPAELDFYLGFGSSTWETGEIHIYCAIHLNNSRKTLSVNLHQRDPKAKSNLRKFTVKRKCLSCLFLFCSVDGRSFRQSRLWIKMTLPMERDFPSLFPEEFLPTLTLQ